MGRVAKGPDGAGGAANHRGGPASARQRPPRGGPCLCQRRAPGPTAQKPGFGKPGFSAREQKVENHLSAVGHDFTSLAWWVVVVLLLIAVLLVLILWKD